MEKGTYRWWQRSGTQSMRGYTCQMSHGLSEGNSMVWCCAHDTDARFVLLSRWYVCVLVFCSSSFQWICQQVSKRAAGLCVTSVAGRCSTTTTKHEPESVHGTSLCNASEADNGTDCCKDVPFSSREYPADKGQTGGIAAATDGGQQLSVSEGRGTAHRHITGPRGLPGGDR